MNEVNLDDLQQEFGRYLDSDGDGIGYRTIPGTHASKGSYFTRGSSHDEYARYTESEKVYVRMVDRIAKKWETAKALVPKPEFYQRRNDSEYAMIFYGTSQYAALETMDGFFGSGSRSRIQMLHEGAKTEQRRSQLRRSSPE